MKNLLFVLFSLFSFSNFLVAQPSVYNGKVNPLRAKGTGPKTVEELTSQLLTGTTNFIGGVSASTWIQKAMEGANYNIDRIGYAPITDVGKFLWLVEHSKIVSSKDLNVSKNDILSSGSLGTSLYWIDNPAVPEYYLVFFTEGGEFLILAKWDCLNPVCDLRKKSTTPVPTPPAKSEESPKKEEEKKDNRIPVGATIYSGGTEYHFTESQARFFYFENQEDMRFRTWRPSGRSKSFCCNGDRLDYSKFVFEPNEPHGKGHGGKKTYFGHR